MALKGVIKPDPIPVNKYELLVIGLPAFTATSVSAIEEVVDSVILPDRTTMSGGNTQPVEFTIMTPSHHTVEYLALELWYSEGQDPQTSTYKKSAVLLLKSGTGAIIRSYALTGVWLCKRKLPELSMENEGDMAQVEWTLKADSIRSLG